MEAKDIEAMLLCSKVYWKENAVNTLPSYSDALVGFVRALDSAEMAVRTGRWHFGDLDIFEPDVMANREDVPSWARQSLEVFADQLPTLRSMFRNMVGQESNGLLIEANDLLDAVPPSFVEAAFKPVLAGYIKHRPALISALDGLPESLVAAVKGQRAVYWDGEVYLIPNDFPDSFVEVWFRRSVGYWEDGGAYPLRLEKRSYGWQAFGIER